MADLEKSLSEIKVKDIMTKTLISVDPETTVFQVANMMQKGGFGAVFVKKNGSPAGIITDRDYAIKITVNKYSEDTTVDKVASYPLQKINGEESILEAASMMSSKKIRKLAVVSDDKVVGVITSTDLVNQLAKNKNV